MIHIWQEKDLKGENTLLGGLVENTKTTAHNRFYMLGYQYLLGGGQHITLISLDDGLVVKSCGPSEMVNYLNTGQYAPIIDVKRIKVL